MNELRESLVAKKHRFVGAVQAQICESFDGRDEHFRIGLVLIHHVQDGDDCSRHGSSTPLLDFEVRKPLH